MAKQVQQHEGEQNHSLQHKAEQKQVQEHVEDEDGDEDEDEQEPQQQHVEDEHQQQQLELTNPNPNSPPPNNHSPPLDLHHSPDTDSPPLDLHHSPDTHSPPLDLHHSPKPKSPPPQEEEEEEEDDKQPPLKPATPSPTKVVVPPPTAPAPPADVGSSGRRHLRPSLSILKRSKRESMLRRALLGCRVSAFVFSLVSFSVLAADKDRGWALDSFNRYKEFRYSLAVNVVAFLYSGFQAFDLVYQLTTGKRQSKSHLRCYFDFFMDQILTYLLMSASSSAAVRIDDWQSNWGKDEFPNMAKASVGLSFVAFLSLGLSSLISGYNLCSLNSM